MKAETVKMNPRPSLRAAIDNKCRECIYDPTPGNGTWRQQVTACTAVDCSLYPVRPLSKGAEVLCFRQPAGAGN
jgi:hypothetical protein